MEREQIKALLARYADGKCTAEEAAQVEAWYRRIAKQQGDSLVDADYAHLYAQAHERLMQSISDSQSPKVSKKNWHWPFYAAAAVLLATLTIVYFFLPEPTDPVQTITTSPILPGGNYATLTVAGGQSLRLDSNQSGISIDGERIVYTDQPIEKAILRMDNRNDVSVPLELTTPNGGTYQVTLADGTIVWLNAASTLKYPSRFTDKKRVVEILGEGYFAVAKDSKKPFIVKAAGQVVEVLGTEFNISAYNDEPVVKTTLVSGAVRVKPMSLSRSNTQLLMPGEQSIVTKTGTLTVAKVDTYVATAWKSGLISLTNVQFDVLMRQLSRWYNIDIKYKGNLSNIRFEGEVTRDVNLEDLLDFFKDSGLLFEITNNRTLIVKAKN